jgi:PilZ domain
MGMYAKLSGIVGRRRDSRLRLSVPAQLITLSGQYNASLCDLSQSGAHLQSRGQLACGEDAVLSWLGFEAFGRIVWASDGEAGMEFDELLPPAILLQTRDQVDLGYAPTVKQAEYDAAARSWYLDKR